MEHSNGENEEKTIFFRVLTDSQIARIRKAAFNILKDTGAKIIHKNALELLREAGAEVNGERVKIPENLIESCIESTPKGFIIYNRDCQRAMDVWGRNFYYGTSTASPNTKPLDEEVRETRVSDIALAAKVADALPNIDYVMPMGSAQDVPAVAADLYEFYATVTNTTKPIIFLTYSPRGLQLVYEMAAIIAGGMDKLQQNPFVVSMHEPVTPLLFPEDVVERMFITADLNLPQIPAPTVQPGATAPVTMAGAVAQLVAEGLMSLVLIQLRNPGAPCVLGGNYNIFDMKTTLLSIAAPEMSLGIAAQAEVARSLGLPSWGLAGSTDSKLLDAQAGAESIYSILTQGLARLNLIHDVGYMDMAMVCSVEMLCMGDELIGMAKKFINGFVIDDETLGEPIIASVGPGGHFLREKHTYYNFRKELWMPTLMTREHYTKWQGDGAKDLPQRIKEKIKTILETHIVPPLPNDILEKLEKIKIEGERELVQKAERRVS